MTTTIAPGLGHAPVLTQAGTGASPGYDAIDFRRLSTIGLQEGVMDVHSFEVTQRSAGGAGMFVDIAANIADALGTGVAAVVQGDAVAAQGLYPVPPHTAVITEAIATANATLPRVDIVVLEVLDNTHDASGSNLARVRVITGTATSGANLTNRTNAPALPNGALLLADVLVGAAVSSITNANIRDRRKWARGAFWKTVVTAGDYTRNNLIMAEIDTTNLKPRIECAGNPIIVTLDCLCTDSTATVGFFFDLFQDGTELNLMRQFSTPAANVPFPGALRWTIVPSAGSHQFAPGFASSVGGADTMKVYANTTFPLMMTVEEVLRQNTANNPTTTG